MCNRAFHNETNVLTILSQFEPVNPKPFLKTLIDKKVIVRLKWNQTEYSGTLVSTDNYMNLQLEQAHEIIRDVDGNKKAEELLGEIFIRCNNVLYIREDKTAEVEMEEP